MKVHELISDELWASIEPLLPPHPPPQGGNRWLPDRPALCGIIYVLKTGMRWNDLPLELGCGSGAGRRGSPGRGRLRGRSVREMHPQ